DGIRDGHVTGVQTCALPILTTRSSPPGPAPSRSARPARSVSSKSTAPPTRTGMFSDRARINVQAGRGGDGSLHFRREKHVPKGGPDGGDGGPGGDVVVVADPDLRDLSAFRGRRWFQAGSGQPGRGALKHGATGETVGVRV